MKINVFFLWVCLCNSPRRLVWRQSSPDYSFGKCTRGPSNRRPKVGILGRRSVKEEGQGTKTGSKRRFKMWVHLEHADILYNDFEWHSIVYRSRSLGRSLTDDVMSRGVGSSHGQLLDCCTTSEKPNSRDFEPTGDILQLHLASIQGNELLVLGMLPKICVNTY